jgi:hypothetical protein
MGDGAREKHHGVLNLETVVLVEDHLPVLVLFSSTSLSVLLPAEAPSYSSCTSSKIKHYWIKCPIVKV